MKVGLCYNLRRSLSQSDDAEAEYDSYETIFSIKSAIENAGFEVQLIEAVPDRLMALTDSGCDIFFNFAEGKNGRGREAQIPAILSFLDIPYTGSDEVSLSVALDKALTKRIVATAGVLTPKFQLFNSPGDRFHRILKFPLIVKPVAEGSSKGIIDHAVVRSEIELRDSIEMTFARSAQPVLVEEFIRGREVTVGLLGNGNDLEVLPILETLFKTPVDFYSFLTKKYSAENLEFTCPASIEPAIVKKINKYAKTVFQVLGLRDVARMDFRISEDGKPYFLEVNPIPGLAPNFSDLPKEAMSAGLSYENLILKILYSAIKRCNLKVPGLVALV